MGKLKKKFHTNWFVHAFGKYHGETKEKVQHQFQLLGTRLRHVKKLFGFFFALLSTPELFFWIKTSKFIFTLKIFQ